MRPRPVVAGLALLFSLAATQNRALAEQATLVPLSVPSYTSVFQHSSSQLKAILDRADTLARQTNFSPVEPVTFVLHGDEINLFRRANYLQNQDLVDLAARLDAFRVIDVQVCETWMRTHQVRPEDLPPFVETVPYGPDRLTQLRAQGVLEF